MRGGSLPPALLFAALAFALAFAPRRAVLPALGVVVVMALVSSRLTFSARWQDAIFFGLWAGVVGSALTVHLPGGPGPRVALLLAANAGIWAGVVIGASGAPLDLARAALALLVIVPARWLAATRARIAVKVVASWLVAVAILAATLPIGPTPGYVQDHME